MTRKEVHENFVLHPGGLMRCCVLSLRQWVEKAPEVQVEPDELISCAYEPPDQPQMIVDFKGKCIRWTGANWAP